MSDVGSSILIVDDDPRMRAIVAEVIRCSHGEVLEASEGHAAVTLFRSHRPDWVIMDLEMPGMDGLNATREICRDDPKARVIMLSIHDSPEIRNAALASGAREFLPKEDLSQLNVVLERILAEDTAVLRDKP